MRIVLSNQYMTVETFHFRLCNRADPAKKCTGTDSAPLRAISRKDRVQFPFVRGPLPLPYGGISEGLRQNFPAYGQDSQPYFRYVFQVIPLLKHM